MTAKEMMLEFKQKDINTDLYLPMFYQITNGIHRTVTIANIDWMVHETFKRIPDIEKNKTATSNMYNLYKIGGKMYDHSKEHLSKLHDQSQTTYYAVHHNDYEIPMKKHFEMLRRDILGIPEILKSNTQPITSNSNRSSNRNFCISKYFFSISISVLIEIYSLGEFSKINLINLEKLIKNFSDFLMSLSYI